MYEKKSYSGSKSQAITAVEAITHTSPMKSSFNDKRKFNFNFNILKFISIRKIPEQ